MNWSLKFALISALLIPLILFRLLSGYIQYQHLSHRLVELNDTNMALTIDAVVHQINEAPVQQQDSVLLDEISFANKIIHERSFIAAAFDTKRQLIAGDHRLRETLPKMGEASTKNFNFGGTKYRVKSVPIIVQGKRTQLVFGQSLGTVDLLLSESLYFLIVLQGTIIVLILVTVPIVVSIFLRPVEELERIVKTDPSAFLQNDLPKNTPKELLPFIQTIRDLLTRKENDLKTHLQFFQNASHELKTPIACIQNLLELGTAKGLFDSQKKYRQDLASGLTRLKSIVKRLLSLSHATSGAAIEHKEIIDLSAICEEIVEQYTGKAIISDIDLGLEILDEEPMPVIGNRSVLVDAIENLIENALHHCPRGSRVTVRLGSDIAPYLVVEDDGPGIPEAYRDKVFDRFFRVPYSKVEGSGLGLAIVKEACEVLDADITLTSGTNGVGACFTMKFPERVLEN